MKNYFKNNRILILIFILAIFLRLNYDIFINGYNHDEMAIASVAIQSFPFGILKTAANIDFHAPLYQLIIHFFMGFNHEWVYIRLFNLVISLLNIYVLYRIGTLIKDKSLGYILALILTVNHLEISTVSFVKFYCMGYFLVSCSLYYFTKILKVDEGYNRLGLVNILLILVSTHGFIYVFLEYLVLFIFKKDSKKILKSASIAFIGFILYAPMLTKQIILNHDTIFSPHSHHPQFSFLSFYNVLNDHLGPLLNFCCNLVTVESTFAFMNFIISVKKNAPDFEFLYQYLFFSFFIVAISVGFYFASFKNKLARGLIVLNLLYLFVYFIITKLEFTGAIPIYLFCFALNFLVTIGIGVSELKNKKIAYILFAYIIFANLMITNCYPPAKRELYGAKVHYCYEVFYKNHPEYTDTPHIVTYSGRFLKEYYKDKNILDFDSEKMSGVHKRGFLPLIFGEDVLKGINKKNARDRLAPLILSHYRSPEFEKYFKKEIVDKTDEYIIFSFFNDKDVPFIEDEKDYKKTLMLKYRYHLAKATVDEAIEKTKVEILNTYRLSDIIKSYSNDYLIDLLDKYFERVKFEQYTRTSNDDYKKVYDDTSNKYSTKWLAKNANKSWIFVIYKKR